MISVIIPSYNRAKTILPAVESVLNQTYKDLELFVVDDGSTDNTEEILSSITDSRFHYIKQTNQGACAARNLGIELSKGEYIALHDSDDIWHADKLEKQLQALESHPNVDFVFCWMNGISDDGKINPIGTFPAGILPKSNAPFGISTQTFFAKREVFENLKFDPQIPRLQDFDLLYRIHQQYTLYCVAEPLVDYYLSDDSISKKPLKLYTTCKIFITKYPELKKRYPFIAYCLATSILNETRNLNKEQRKSYLKDICKTSLFYSKNLKIIIKIFLVKLNLL